MAKKHKQSTSFPFFYYFCKQETLPDNIPAMKTNTKAKQKKSIKPQLNRMKTKLILLLLSAATICGAQQRKVTTLADGWLFSRDKLTWQQVSVPHDWAINGPFDKKWDLQTVAIEQDGETEATEKSGRSGALPWIGKGHYKTTITLPEGYGHAELLFDGAMSEPVVKVNGKEAGRWAYGYNAFRVDITPYAKAGRNTVEVDLQNVEESSRWYPGGGIYRPVKLIVTSKTRLNEWEGWFRTEKSRRKRLP